MSPCCFCVRLSLSTDAPPALIFITEDSMRGMLRGMLRGITAVQISRNRSAGMKEIEAGGYPLHSPSPYRLWFRLHLTSGAWGLVSQTDTHLEAF